MLFRLAGLGAGVLGAAVAWAIEPAWPLALFVYVLAQYAVSRVLARALAGERWLVSAAFPVVAALVLAAARGVWDEWWRSVLAALVIAAVVQPLLDQTEKWAEPRATPRR